MATKTKTVWFCNQCGYESAKWLGKCPGCGEWNTFVEEKVTVTKGKTVKKGLVKSQKPVSLSDIEIKEEAR